MTRDRYVVMGGRAFVILDVANIRHEISEMQGRPGRQSELFIRSVRAVLSARNYDVTGIAVSMPLLVVSETSGTDQSRALDLAKRARDWVQREATKNKFEVLQGGIDGNREIGVDDLIVVRTLIEAEAIRTNPNRAGEKILVFSHDSDLQHLSQFADGVQVRILGHIARFNDERMRARRIEFEGLAADEMLSCAVDSTEVPPAPQSLLAQRSRVLPLQLPQVVTAGTVVVVDGYGVACSAAAALGIAELPNAESVRDCVEALGYSGVNSVQFVLPDVHIKVRPRQNSSELTSYERSAWAARDAQLDGLDADLKNDHDPGTEVVRGYLVPAHIPDEARVDPLRQETIRHLKQHSTLLTASAVRHWLRAEADDVVVMTDVPDVVLALDYLLLKFSHVRPTRIMRVGTRARPLLPATGGRHFRLPYFVLTEGRLAQLVRVRGRAGRSLRDAVELSTTGSGLLHEQWQVVAFEPEILGYRVQSCVRPDVEVVIMDAERLNLNVNDVVDGKELNLAIYADPNQPIDPLVTVARMLGGADVGTLVAEAARRDSDAIHFDLDGDRQPDVRLPIGHDFQPVRPGARAILGYLHGDSTTLRYVAVESMGEVSPVQLEARVTVSDVDSSAVFANGLGSDNRVHAIQGAPLVDITVGDEVMVTNVGDTDGPHYVLLSSALGTSPLGK